MKVFTHKNVKSTVFGGFFYKLVCVDNKFNKPIVVYKGENASYWFIGAILKEYEYCKKVMKKHFNKIWSWMKKEKKIFDQVTHARYVKNWLMMKK